MENKVYCFFNSMLEVQAKAPVPKTQAMTYPIVPGIDSQDKIICFVAQQTQPWCQSGNAIKKVTMHHKIMPAIGTNVFALIDNFYGTKASAVLHKRSQKLVVITSHIYDTSTAFAMTQHTTYHVSVTLLPAPFVLFDFPGIYDVSHKIQSMTRMMFEKVVEFVSLTVFGAKMYVTDENGSISLFHHLFRSNLITMI
jgi:hypothetical protein